jgi:hypothetical protein
LDLAALLVQPLAQTCAKTEESSCMINLVYHTTTCHDFSSGIYIRVNSGTKKQRVGVALDIWGLSGTVS